MTKMFLLKSSKMSMKPLVQNVGDMYQMYGQLPDVVKHGEWRCAAEHRADMTSTMFCCHCVFRDNMGMCFRIGWHKQL